MVKKTKKIVNVIDYYSLKGVEDLCPPRARINFARALYIEDLAGHTTPKADEQLDRAIKYIS